MAAAAVPFIDNIYTLPQPSHITLLLRHHKSVTFLSVSPTQSFESIKTLLLEALKARNITALPQSSQANPTATNNTIAVPISPSDIELGILTDKKDASKGWTLLSPDSAVPTSSSSKKKSAAASASASSRPTSGDIAHTPAGVGLVDGSWLAYRVKRVDDAEPMVDDKGDVMIDMEGDPGWDVVLPAFDDEDPADESVNGDGMEGRAAGPS